MASGTGQNATVEEILASIRQAIAEDDARRIGAHPPLNADDVRIHREDDDDDDRVALSEDMAIAEIEADAAADAAAVGSAPDIIEKAIEQAVDGVRAELEAERASFAGRFGRSGQSAIPRASRPLSSVRRQQVAIPRPTLLSQGPDAQVSASFDRLANAMVSGDAPKLDAAVEDVLRPMLKTWLDNNLPQMVERLVREEIERVTRGRR